MKKNLIMLVAFVMSFATLSAQTATEQQSFTDNTYVGVGFGGYTPLSFDGFLPINSAAHIRLGKWVDPAFGFEIDGSVWFGSNADESINGGNFDNGFNVHNFVRATNVGLNGLINLSNLIGGYDGHRRAWEFNFLAGLGWTRVFNPSSVAYDFNSVYAKTGFDVIWNFGQEKEHGLVLQPNIMWNLNETGFSGINFHKNRAQLGLSIGYVYRFAGKNKTHGKFRTYNVGGLLSENAALADKVEKLENRPPRVRTVIKKVEVEKEVVKYVPLTYLVCFAQNSAELTDEAKTELDKVPTDVVVSITASASPEGPSSYNQKLSEKRAEAVKTYLTERGIRVETATGVGEQGKTSNRLAIISIK